MDIGSLLLQQFTDVFRLGLLAGLIFTTERTRHQSGVLLPLLAGVVFVAFIIPTTMPRPDVSLGLAIATGIIVNAIIVGAFWLAWEAYSKAQRS